MASAPESVGLSAQLLSRYAGACPRYTSYPTADRFAPLAGAEPWAVLARVRSLSLYVHIPFCHSLCYFCACNKVITHQYGLASSYLDTLLEEARWYRERVPRVPVLQLHLGGGTPTYLSDGDLRRLVDGLAKVFELRRGDDVEYSVEADPRSLEPETLATLRELGFNRLSLGVQDFDDDVQRAINRICTADQVAAVTGRARELGFRSISYDLIYGLPRQSLAIMQRTVAEVVRQRPDRIALYHYAHLPERFRAQRLIDTDSMPAPAEKIAMQLAAVRALEGAGYEFLGMDHFALPGDALARAAREGRLERNFQGYTVMPADALVGLGASAISYSGDGYWQNQHRLKDYVSAVTAAGSAACRGRVLTADDRMRQRLIMELMCRLQIDKVQWQQRLGAPFDTFFRCELARLQPMVDDGLVRQDSGRLWITPRGRWFTRNVAAAFDAHLHRAAEPPRYSNVL